MKKAAGQCTARNTYPIFAWKQAWLSLLPLSAGFLFDIPLDVEDGCDVFLKSFYLSLHYTALQPRRPQCHYHINLRCKMKLTWLKMKMALYFQVHKYFDQKNYFCQLLYVCVELKMLGRLKYVQLSHQYQLSLRLKLLLKGLSNSLCVCMCVDTFFTLR